jgi:hypothetical protein
LGVWLSGTSSILGIGLLPHGVCQDASLPITYNFINNHDLALLLLPSAHNMTIVLIRISPQAYFVSTTWRKDYLVLAEDQIPCRANQLYVT